MRRKQEGKGKGKGKETAAPVVVAPKDMPAPDKVVLPADKNPIKVRCSLLVRLISVVTNTTEYQQTTSRRAPSPCPSPTNSAAPSAWSRPRAAWRPKPWRGCSAAASTRRSTTGSARDPSSASSTWSGSGASDETIKILFLGIVGIGDDQKEREIRQQKKSKTKSTLSVF